LDWSIKETIWIAFDTETTGLSPVMDRVVEIGAVKFDTGGNILGEFQTLINPQRIIPPNVTAVHGITNEEVQDAPPAGSVLPAFLEFLGTCDNILIAHNASFDAGFIGAELDRAGLVGNGHMILDTLAMSRRVLKGIQSHSLDCIARDLEIDARGHHRALADSEMTREVFLHLLDRMSGVETFEALLDFTRIYRFTGYARIPGKGVEGFEHFQRAIGKGMPVMIVYRGGSHSGIPRRITPQGIINTSGHHYIRAFCHIDGQEKEFRLDKVECFLPVDG
jgi:DNA polymerase-3 subunit epsilon